MIQCSREFKKALLVVTVVVIGNCLISSVNAATISMDFQRAVDRANNHDPRISEKQQLVGVAQGMLQEATGSHSWIYDVNAFAAFAPKEKGGVTESGGIQVVAEDAFDFDGISPWYSIQFSIIRPLYTYNKVEKYAEAAKHNIEISEGDVQLERARVRVDLECELALDARAVHPLQR